MNNLKLVTTEKFGELDCNFYRNMNDDILLTREQIGSALEYANPQKAIQKIHLNHKDRLDDLCIRIAENRTPCNGGAGVKVETVYYSQRGVMEICRWSRQTKADEFMDWTWAIVEKYRNGELNQINIQPITGAITILTTIVTTMEQDVSTLQAQIQQNQIPKKKSFSPWTSKMFPKYQLLMDYFDIGRKELYHNLFIELQNTYPDIDLRQEQDDYCFENGLDSCFTLDLIEHNKKLRMLFAGLVDSLLEKYKIAPQNDQVIRQSTIFDETL